MVDEVWLSINDGVHIKRKAFALVEGVEKRTIEKGDGFYVAFVVGGYSEQVTTTPLSLYCPVAVFTNSKESTAVVKVIVIFAPSLV